VDRELVLALLAALFGGSAAWLGGSRPARRQNVEDAQHFERLSWRELWLPLLPPAAVLAALAGWALREPADAEALPPALVAASLPFLLVWARALARAMARLGAPHGGSPAFTVGLLRPRAVLSPRLAAALDVAALHAAHEHELAHVRRRDPLRVWLAELAADLQWPWPAAQARLGAWRRALELACDEEARRRGVDGADLAAAIVGAARLVVRPAPGTVGLTESSALDERVHRLLAPLPPAARRSLAERFLPALSVLGLLGACAAGAIWGEDAVRSLLGAVS
jgi:hypothetical protein